MAKSMFKADEACRLWWGKVSSVAELFERRWTRLALKRADPLLAERLEAQQKLFDAACLHGTVSEVELQGGGMVRGWMTVIKRMETFDIPDDAYMLGADPVSGLKVAIGFQKAAVDRVVELHGQDVVWITPDEVATLMARIVDDSHPTAQGVEVGALAGRMIEAFKVVGAVKQTFPGAEILRYGNEGS